jgi:hypothetical protein
MLRFDNVLAGPHTAGVTRETRFNLGKIAAEQVLEPSTASRLRAKSIRKYGRCSAVRTAVRLHTEVIALLRRLEASKPRKRDRYSRLATVGDEAAADAGAGVVTCTFVFC